MLQVRCLERMLLYMHSPARVCASRILHRCALPGSCMDVCFQEAFVWEGFTCAQSIPTFFLTVQNWAQMKFRKGDPRLVRWISHKATQQIGKTTQKPHLRWNHKRDVCDLQVTCKLEKISDSRPRQSGEPHFGTSLGENVGKRSGDKGKVDLKWPGRKCHPVHETWSRVPLSHGPNSTGGYWRDSSWQSL